MTMESHMNLNSLLGLSLAGIARTYRRYRNAAAIKHTERDIALTSREIAEKRAAKCALQGELMDLKAERNSF